MPNTSIREGRDTVVGWSEETVLRSSSWGLGLAGVVDGVMCVEPAVYVPPQGADVTGRVVRGC